MVFYGVVQVFQAFMGFLWNELGVLGSSAEGEKVVFVVPKAR